MKSIKQRLLKIASQSHDPHTQVGCLILDKHTKEVSRGVNGMPAGMPETPELWSRPTKYDFVIHAEANAIVYAEQKLTDCILYSTLEPCIECSKLIAAAGIKKVFYIESRPDIKTQNLVKACNISWNKLL